MPWRKGNRLKLVREAEANEPIRPIYEDIKQTLGLPHVNAIFQAYAAYPDFLERHWKAFKPVLQTQEFFVLAGRLRAEAYTRMHNYFPVPDFCARLREQSLSSGALQDLTAVVELFHYSDPPLLLLAAAQLQAFEVRIGRDATPTTPADHPVFEDKPAFINEDDAPPEIRRVYEEIKRTLGLPIVNADYRAFARYPDFLIAYWDVLKPILQSPVYSESQQGMRESAWNLVRELPARVDTTVSHLLDDGLSDDDLSDVVRITDLFLRNLSGLVLDVAVAKIAVEGGNRKNHQPERAA